MTDVELVTILNNSIIVISILTFVVGARRSRGGPRSRTRSGIGTISRTVIFTVVGNGSIPGGFEMFIIVSRTRTLDDASLAAAQDVIAKYGGDVSALKSYNQSGCE